ncbi:MAG TPA: hypothetical protein PLD14_02705 [Candidatus Pacearchaeota archaeon]|nr:hypothetical protein [Candidatus Pacearchaeota archaeon]HPR80111.1 hypothetical protein [Candidatus Pacearchaeota archaeon]
MDVVIKELMNVTHIVLKKKHIEFHELEVLLEKLLEVDEIEIKGRNRNDGTIYSIKLPNEYKSLPRLKYILKKWIKERSSGKEEKTNYVLGEESDKTSQFDNKITYISSKP